MKLFNMVLVAGLLTMAATAMANDAQDVQIEESQGTLIFDSEWGSAEAAEEFALRPPPRRAPPRRDPPPRRNPPPRAAIYQCNAVSLVRPWNLYRGYRSYFYNEARASALHQCEYYEGAPCIVRSCYQF